MLAKIITAKLAVSSTTDASLNNPIFVDVFLIEEYEYAALPKGPLIAPFRERFKGTTLGKAY